LIETILRAAFGSRVRFDVPRANPPVSERINAVNAALRNAAGQVRLRISPRCVTLRRDFERVSYRTGTAEVNKTAAPELTHISDALGYYIVRRYPLPRIGQGPVTYGFM
jgi:hypothetical protein